MKTGIYSENYNEKKNGYTREPLSIKDILLWFTITAAALCLAGTSQAGSVTKETQSGSTVTANK